MDKPRIKCYTLWDTWWYEFPDGRIGRVEPNMPWIKTWQDIYKEQVPFLFY